jgi:hypothetical protein
MLATTPAFLSLILAAPAPLLPTMQWKFREGQTFTLRSETTAKSALKVLGMDMTQNQQQALTHRFTVQKVNRDGSVEFEMFVVDASGKVEMGGGAPIEIPGLEKLRGAKFNFTLNARREVTDIEGFQAFQNRLKPEEQLQLSMQFSELNLKESLAELFSSFPARTVNKGDAWQRQGKQDIGPLGSVEQKHSYRYEGKTTTGERTFDRVTSTSVWQFTPRGPAAPGQGVLPFQLKAVNLKPDDIKSELLFDASSGRLHELKQSARLKGKMTIDVGGMDTEIEMDQQSQTKITLLPK